MASDLLTTPGLARTVAAGTVRAKGRAPIAALLLAACLALAGALVPAAVPGSPFTAVLPAAPALAADTLDVATTARYVVVPSRAVVRVTVDVTAVNLTPSSSAGGVVTQYYYDSVNLAVQPEAARIQATQDGVALRLSTATRSGYRLVTIRFRAQLFYGDSAHVRLTFDLPAGAPRSSSGVRVGAAFATFLAWAFGDRGSVEVDVPGSFAVDTTGDPMTSTTGSGGAHVLVATTTSATDWYAWIDARNDAGLTRDTLRITGGEQIIVRAWPEDRPWQQRVATLLTAGVPNLVARIGLPWPVDGPLSVLEIHAPLLEGYSGFYNTSMQEITISEDLDDLTIVHEASHAWFSSRLFTERWITEGLADEYASRTLASLGIHVKGPAAVAPTADVAFPLDAWPPPAPIRDRSADAREQWGYDASWTVIRRVVAGVGEAGMRRVFAAAAAGTTAYVGRVEPEPSGLPNDWRRFLDLTEELAGGKGVADLIAGWALTPEERAVLAPRGAAVSAYHALVGRSGSWAAPVVVRMALDGWDFTTATTTIGEAGRILDRRDATATRAAAERLTPPSSLEAAYEGAATEPALGQAATQADGLGQALTAVAAADAAGAAPRDWLVTLGLAGLDPDARIAAARAAWEAGDVATAAGDAQAATVALATATDAGRVRAVALGLTALAVIVLLIAAVMTVRRRRRTRLLARTSAASTVPAQDPAQAQVPAQAPAQGPFVDPAPTGAEEPYATLPASADAGAEPDPPAIDADEGAESS